MQCIRPIKAGYDSAGDITYSSKNVSKELAPFMFPCRKCLPCRLNDAREKAVRAWHESRMHENNIFLTCTYADENLKSPKLNQQDFVNFMKSLREARTRYVTDPELKKALSIPCVYVGEYGDLNKRPHWHALLFNYAPKDRLESYKTDSGELVFSSETLGPKNADQVNDGVNRLWNHGKVEFGSITMDSANYVARYSAKKLVHGKDQDHDYHPIYVPSKKYAIGKNWLEKNYVHTFENGYVVLPNSQTTSIPRYYEDWAKKHQNELWRYYVTTVKPKIAETAMLRARKEELEYITSVLNKPFGCPNPMTRSKVKLTILESKFKQLQEFLKL